MKKFFNLSFFKIIFLFFILNFLTLQFLAPQIPFLGFFPYRDVAQDYNLPEIFTNLANFDGVHYLRIAAFGYGQYEQAFFPLYPIIIKYFSLLTSFNLLTSALILSNLFFIGAIYFFILILRQKELKLNKYQRYWIICFFIFFPTSFFFISVYTESLFLFLFLGSLYFWYQKKYLLAIVFGGLSSATRLIGIFLIIPFFINYISSHSKNSLKFIICFSPLIGLIFYLYYLYVTTGDPLFFFNAQPSFGANRSTSIILFPQVIYRYFKIFIIAAHDYKYYISILEFTTFIFFGSILSLQLIKLIRQKLYTSPILGLNLFSFANLILPTLTGTFSSLPRYSLMSISVFIFLGQIKNIYFKYLILFFFVLLHVLTLIFFSRGYFVS